MSGSPAAEAGVKLLLVDDLPENLLALSALLRRDDVELLQARSGAEALELLLQHTVALALVDVQMPLMDGFELAEIMRGSSRTRGVPIVFVTAGASDERRIFQGYDSGAVDFLYKPINAHILQSKVDVFVQLEQQKQRLARELYDKTETLRLNEMFSAMLGHDLRGPLSVILMSAMLQLKRCAPDDEITRQSATRTLDSAKRMSRMISDMLDLARARVGGGLTLKRQRFDLGTLFDTLVEELATTDPERPVAVERLGDLAGDWDADRLAQAVTNLLANAVRHGDTAVPVRCTLDGTDAQQVVISIHNGGEIDPALVPHLFDPFRDQGTYRSRGDGLGLGLYIVGQVANAHGGRVDVRSDNGSTTFAMRLPRTALLAG